MKPRLEAIKLVNEWIKSDSLKAHCLGVAASMEEYAEKLGEDQDKWWICGLLHDFDWERHPSLEGHPSKGVEHLRSIGVDEEICVAIMGHGNHTGVARESMMAKTLFAVDELSGLIVALARVRPGNFEGMKAKSVRKVMKKKEFAAAINRDDIRQGMSELGFGEDVEKENEHLELVIKALDGVRVELGF